MVGLYPCHGLKQLLGGLEDGEGEVLHGAGSSGCAQVDRLHGLGQGSPAVAHCGRLIAWLYVRS